MQPLVTVITATTGDSCLVTALESVKKQTYGNIRHLVVIDGDHAEARRMVAGFNDIDVIQLPYATGTNGYLGHRIYGAATFLAEGEYVCFLDEDNWMDPEHVASLMDVIRQGHDWAYSLRKIVDRDNKVICNDDCESLGKWHSVFGENDFLVDVSCYLLPKNVALGVSPLWHRKARDNRKGEADRTICATLLGRQLSCQTTGLYTLNYRAGNRGDSVMAGFFLEGNRKMAELHQGSYPWRKQ
jgi:glycosyltransferase involved in cell wall biosynthesis